MKSQGFTLIELLIAVLIIGILAAIAVPQYKKSVRKTWYAGMLPVLKNVIQAQDTYYLTNGTYATKWSQLDVQISGGGTCNINNGCQKGYYWAVNEKVCMCLGTRGQNESPTMMISFNTTSGIAGPSGYEYLFGRTEINAHNHLDAGLYCREPALARDYHCTGRAARHDWYGRWFLMD